jgi:hypothetical protein
MANWIAIVRSSVILAKITGSFSIIGSFLLARHILHKRKQSGRGDLPLSSILLLNISVVNIIGVFFTFFMGPWMNGAHWDRFEVEGNINTAACTAQGFFLYFAEVYFLTAYAGLGTLYFLIVRRGWTKNDWEKKRIKAAFLLPPVIVSLAFSVPPLFYQMYNPTPPVMCMLTEYPPLCDEEDSDVQCTRGQNALLAQQIELLYALICNLVIIIFMGLLVLSVYRTEKKGDKYLSKGQAKKRDNTIDTAWQGVRYGGAITVPFLPLYVFLGVSLRGTSMNDTNSLVWFVSLAQSIVSPTRCFFLSNSSFSLPILSIYILFSLLSLDLIMVSGFYYFLFAIYLRTDSNFHSHIAHFTPAQHAFTSIQSIKHTGNVIKICLQYGAFVTLYTLVFLKRYRVAGRSQSLTITQKQQNLY